MEAHTFALVSMFGLPITIVGLLALVYKLTPKHIWRSFRVQAIVTPIFLGAIASPVLVLNIDSQGEYFDDRQALVQSAFALPDGVEVSYQRDRTLRLGDCWRNAVNWRSEVKFSSDREFDRWNRQTAYKQAMVDQIAAYFGEEPDQISIAEGALDKTMRDAKYQLVDDLDSYRNNVRILEFYEPHVCTAIDRDEAGRITLRRCDAIAEPVDQGNEGWVIINPSAKKKTLEGRIFYASGPSYCTNPVRRATNAALGLPHPEGGEPNTSMGGILPIF